MRKSGLSTMTGLLVGSLVQFEARNLWLLKSDVPHIDPEASIFPVPRRWVRASDHCIPSARSYGFNIKRFFKWHRAEKLYINF